MFVSIFFVFLTYLAVPEVIERSGRLIAVTQFSSKMHGVVTSYDEKNKKLTTDN